MRKIHYIGTSLLALTVAHPAYAQVAPPQAAEAEAADSDEIIVTATKREQTLQDVPISVSVTGSETVEKAQIRDLIDLQSVVPSLKVSQLNAVGQTNFIIRGFGNGNGNDGIESSVGVFIDGVYRARTSAALDDLPEIERIEVLRGPQSTLFGKNVSAGAISIVTKKPQFDWGGKAEISLGNYGLINPKATITGPISDSLAFRLSGSVNSRNGYFRNISTKGDANNRNRWSLRADILFQPSADFSLRVIGDYNIIKEQCCGVTGIQNGPATLAIGGGLGKPISNTSQIFSRNIVFDANPQNRLVGKGLSGQIDWNIGFAKLTSITAYRNQVNQSNQDVDFTGADIVTNNTANEISTFTQEFRLASEGNGPFSWLVGGFFQDEKVDTARDIRYGKDIRAFANALTGGTATAPSLITTLESLQRITNPAIIPGGTYFQPGQGISDAYKLKQQSYSLFGQADFKVTERLTVTGGLAYLHDRKAAVSNVVMNDPFSALDLNRALTESVPGSGQSFIPLATPSLAGLAGCLFQKGFVPTGPNFPIGLFGGALGARLPGAGSAPCPASLPGVNPFNLNPVQFFYGDTTNHAPVNFPNATESGIFSGSKVTYAGRVAYDFDIINAYVSYSTGWKATAVNLSSDSRPANNGVGRSAAPEEVTVYEAGIKAKFRGGFFNLAVFKQEIKGFQSNGFTGLGYALVNAGKQSVKGFEIDAAYRPAPWLALTGAITYLDGKYDSFTQAPCFSYDTVRCPRDAKGVLKPSRDLSGTKPAGVPTWSGSASATINHNFNDTLSGYLRGEFDYTSDTYLTETTPANLATYGSSNVNLSIGFQDSEAKLEVMGWVRNLTNDNALLATFPTVGQGFPEPASYSGYPNQPRTYGVTLRKTF
jgi:iron complex outermembrane recepter protein